MITHSTKFDYLHPEKEAISLPTEAHLNLSHWAETTGGDRTVSPGLVSHLTVEFAGSWATGIHLVQNIANSVQPEASRHFSIPRVRKGRLIEPGARVEA
eukprot:1392169-Amorphochlora_amoeboformis.AAC.2